MAALHSDICADARAALLRGPSAQELIPQIDDLICQRFEDPMDAAEKMVPINAENFGATLWRHHRLSPMRMARWAGKFLLYAFCDLPTRIADILYSIGLRRTADQFLWRAYCAYPYDHALGEYLANCIYDHHQHKFAVGSIVRGRFLMQVLERSYPSPRVTAAYFDNLTRVLDKRVERDRPGQVILGLGAGRCGSTTLAGILHTIEGAVSTHESPPFIHWEPLPLETQFHLRRFEIFRRYVPLIADCAHWWINSLDQIFDAFPDSKAIGMFRNTDACVQSWMSVSPPDINHFVSSHNRIWPPDRWDPLYPHYELPADARQNRTRTKEQLIRRYVEEYNQRLKILAARLPERILLLSTEELDSPTARARISEFVQLRVSTDPIRLNVSRDWDAGSADGLYF
jgi:hypothetical protein